LGLDIPKNHEAVPITGCELQTFCTQDLSWINKVMSWDLTFLTWCLWKRDKSGML